MYLDTRCELAAFAHEQHTHTPAGECQLRIHLFFTLNVLQFLAFPGLDLQVGSGAVTDFGFIVSRLLEFGTAYSLDWDWQDPVGLVARIERMSRRVCFSQEYLLTSTHLPLF